MHGEGSVLYLRETLLFLALTGVLIPLLQRLRVNQVLGFLAAGTLLGPHGLGVLIDRVPSLAWLSFRGGEVMSVLAELGVIFLMFLIGLELSVSRIRELRRWVFGAGIAQVLLSGALLCGALASVGLAWTQALVLGLVLALSSTAVVMQLLTERHALATPAGQAVFSVLMLQDLAVVPLLIVIGVMGASTGAGVGWLLSLALLKSVAAIVVIYLLGRRLVGPMFHAFCKQRQPEVFMSLTLLTVLSIGGATAAAGLSMALGAFVAGLLLADTPFRHEVEVTVEPLKGLLMGVFFMSVGMGVDLAAVAREPLALLAATAALVLVKAVAGAVVFRLGGLPAGRALESGLLLSQGGEFAFVAIGQAAASTLLADHVARFAMLVVSASLFATPLLARLGALVAGRLQDSPHFAPEDDAAHEGLADHVVIAGCGRVGQLLAEVFAGQSVPFVAIENDAHAVARLRARGLPVVYGNAARPELLRKLQLKRARAVVMTMDQPAAAMHTVTAIRAEFPSLPVFARSRDEAHAKQLLKAGASVVVPETLEGALQLSGAVLAHLGFDDADSGRTLEAERKRRLQTHPA
ncbi:cation:proton antiporter [Ramlibacter sp. MMS24-I3-19]|uniref:cation:proton antiporter domain-containing protein n=1 Tax=Ramlibacter sp. MMS24-I3-19 TaxID=3416606 RepID=UPI003D0509F1